MSKNTIVADPIHGDIHLSAIEREVIDTPSFQRLRYLKQLGMGHLVYPNATHTRFAHSLGTLAIMLRVLRVAKEHQKISISEEDEKDLRLAALLHDIGHYPYSHLMETVDEVTLTEDFVSHGSGEKRPIDVNMEKYPKHEELGKIIVTTQPDLLEAIGNDGRSQRIAELFTRGELRTLSSAN